MSFANAVPREQEHRVDESSHLADEIKQLRRCVSDLVSITALPAIWGGGGTSEIVRTLPDVLVGMLRLDLVYVRLESATGDPPFEIVRFANSQTPNASPGEIGKQVHECLGLDPRNWPASVRGRIGNNEISIAPFRLGLQGEIGLIVAGAERSDFPRPTESLLLSVAANQVALGLHEARRLSEQRRVASEFEQKVQERTAELQKSNEALVVEIAERRHVERAVRESQRLLHAIINNSSAVIFVKDAEGRYLLVNRQFERVFRCAATDIVGKDDYHLFPREQADSLREFDNEVMRFGAALEKEETLSLEDGTHTYISIKSALRDSDGKVCGLCGIATDITNRRKTLQALRQSEEQYRVVVETANEAVVSIDEASQILFANTATSTIFGYSIAELVGQPLTLLMAESFRPLHQAAIERYAESGQRKIDWRGVEVMGRRKNGEEFPVEVSFGEVVRDGHRVFTGCIRDITERKKAEAIQAAQAQQAVVRADVSAAFAKVDDLKSVLNSCAEAIVRHLSAAFARIWTLNESENVLVLQASAGLYTRLDGTHARVPIGHFKIGRIAQEGKPHLTNDVLNDERVSDRDWAKREGMVGFAGYPLLVEGRVTGVLAMFARQPLNQTALDALETVAEIIAQGIFRKDAEDMLLQRERSLRLLTETIPQMIWGATGSGEIDYCNRQILDYTGRQEDRLRGNGWTEVVHPDDLPGMQESWRSAVAKQLPFEVEIRLRRADGMFRWCLSRAQPLCDERGRVIRWYGSLTDFDDWKRAEQTARRTQAELAHVTRVMTMGELASSIAHEINQPLGAIANYGNASLRLLNGGFENIEKVKHAIAKIVEDANRASGIIARIRALSKKAPTEMVALNLKELIGEVMALTRQELYARLTTSRLECAENLPSVLGDRIQIQQVLLNLVINGLEAMSTVPAKDRTLAIRAYSHEADDRRGVIVRVQDAGVGIHQEVASRLFEAFYTTKPNGLGMGLAICRSIVEAHGGKLWTEPNDGPGATFCFVLPAELPRET